MRYLAGVVLMLMSAAVAAAPFVVTDPLTAGVTQCGVYLDAGAKVTIPVTVSAPGSNICKFDVGTVSAGSHTISMTAITVNDPVWGSQESAKSSPLSFARPGTPGTPTGIVLTP